MLHIFNPDGEYLCSTDGDIECGEWRDLGANKLLFGPSNCDAEVFNLAFLDDDFFILKKHGNERKFSHAYRVFIREPLARMEWNEAIEYLFDKYRNSNGFFITIVVILLLIIVVFLLLS